MMSRKAQRSVAFRHYRNGFCSPSINPVRNSSGALNPVRDLSLNGINPSGIILKSNPAAEQRGIISNGVNEGATNGV